MYSLPIGRINICSKGAISMNKEDILEKIELLREKMISAGMSQGLTSPETIKLSEMLDQLLNKEVVYS
jgi:hypothetical protein